MSKIAETFTPNTEEISALKYVMKLKTLGPDIA